MEPSKTGRKNCYFCGVEIQERYNFCKACAEEHGLLGIRPTEWPEAYRELKNSLDREHYHDIEYRNRTVIIELDGEEADWVQQRAYSNWVTTDRATLEEVLEDYDLTTDEYDIITTDNLKMLAKELGISYAAARKRKQRLLEKLRASNRRTR